MDELAVKEDVRKLLEKLIRTIEPESRLLSFGSTANGFSLRNSGSSTRTFATFMCGGASLIHPSRHGSLLLD